MTGLPGVDFEHVDDLLAVLHASRTAGRLSIEQFLV
jgi:hypothetical protein